MEKQCISNGCSVHLTLYTSSKCTFIITYIYVTLYIHSCQFKSHISLQYSKSMLKLLLFHGVQLCSFCLIGTCPVGDVGVHFKLSQRSKRCYISRRVCIFHTSNSGSIPVVMPFKFCNVGFKQRRSSRTIFVTGKQSADRMGTLSVNLLPSNQSRACCLEAKSTPLTLKRKVLCQAPPVVADRRERKATGSSSQGLLGKWLLQCSKQS